jgi:predicted GIY-YIG superfamily endonuclease
MNYNFYVIWNHNLPDYIYIGCTINDLETRLNEHISHS